MRVTIPLLPHTSLWRAAYLSTQYIFMVWYFVRETTLSFYLLLLGSKVCPKNPVILFWFRVNRTVHINKIFLILGEAVCFASNWYNISCLAE